MEELKRIVELAEESLKVQKEVLEFTKGMHKLLREMNVRVIEKLANI